MTGLFVYGSLTMPEVLDVVIGRVPEHRRAWATGWRAAALLDRPFPGLVPADSTVAGLLLTSMSEHEWTVIDAFEGPMYGKVGIRLDDGTDALTYACTDESLVLANDWDSTTFRSNELTAYLRRCADWRSRSGY